MIPRETIDRIFAAAKIEEVVGRYVSLKKRGANLIGLCPFHHEKTGSFTVSPSKNIYKCFGCSKAGNAVNFIMEIEQCTYPEALRQIAQMYHITIEEKEQTAEDIKKQHDRESMLLVNDFAHRWFQEQLWNTPEGNAVGIAYLRQRGIRDDIIKRFQLGYSPEKARLWEQAMASGYQETYLVNDSDNLIGTGVCLKDEKGRLYDRFRGRVIFPFFSVSGKVTGFAGRLIKHSDKAGKYVNSPTSILYEKRHELYGFYQAKQVIKRENCCYLVEGQLDVIQLVQSGIENVVASGGTALTINQIRLIHRFAENVTILYDGDKAGIKAAIRGIDMLLDEGLNVRIILLPEGEDPDSFARKMDSAELIRYMRENTQDFIQFKTRLLYEETVNDPIKRSEMILSIVESIAKIQEIIKRQVYIKDTAQMLGIGEDVLARKVNEIRRKKAQEGKVKMPIQSGEPKPVEQDNKEGADNPPVPATTTQPQKSESTSRDELLTRIEQNIHNLIQVIMRYGEMIHCLTPEGRNVYVGEYIINEMQKDNVEITNPLYQKIINEYKANYKCDGFVAIRLFQYHPDMEISQMAAEAVADKYQLSQIYSQQSISENVRQEVSIDLDIHVRELVRRLILELKLSMVEERLEYYGEMLTQAQAEGNWDRQTTILAQQPQLEKIRREICQKLGNRVIVN